MGQSSQSALEDLPAPGKNVSTSHSLHTLSPFPSWYRPAGQIEQTPLLRPYLPRSLEEEEDKRKKETFWISSQLLSLL